MGNILVVDDDRGTREVLRLALEDGGHVVAEEASGDRAVSLLKASPVPLVVLLDLYLGGSGTPNPVLGAIEADPSLGAKHRVLVMTADRLDHAEAGMATVRPSLAGLVAKPYDLDALLGTVAEAARSLPCGWGGR